MSATQQQQKQKQGDSAFSFRFDDKEYRIEEFELGDLEWLEEELGASIDDEGVLGSMRAVVRLVYLIKRRDNPDFTIDDARKVKVGKVIDVDQDTDAVETTNGAAGKRPTARDTRKARSE